MKNLYALCGILLPELYHLHRYIFYEERICTLWHLYLQSYAICTDTSVMKNVYALCGICTSRAIVSAQIHLLWRTCMHFVAFVPPELWHLHRYICYEEHVCILWHLYLQSHVVCTCTSVMKNMYSMHSVAFVSPDLYHLNRYVICTEHIYSHYAVFMRSVASVPWELCHMYSTEYICHAERMLYIYLFTFRSVPWRVHLLFRKWRQIAGTVPWYTYESVTHKTEYGTFLPLYSIRTPAYTVAC